MLQVRLGCSRSGTAGIPCRPERLVGGFPRLVVFSPPNYQHHGLHGLHCLEIEPSPEDRVVVVMTHPVVYRLDPTPRRPAKLPFHMSP